MGGDGSGVSANDRPRQGVGRTEGRRTVLVPGGQVLVTVDEHDSTLTGPAVLLATGELSADWWADAAKQH